MNLESSLTRTSAILLFTSAPAGRWHGFWKLCSDSLDQHHPYVYFSQIGQEQSSLLVPRMQGSDRYEWMRKFVTEGVVNHQHLSINFVTRFVRPRVASCHSICSWINIHHLEKSVSYPMIPNVRESVTDYVN